MLSHLERAIPKQPFRLLKEGRGGLVYFQHESCATMPMDPNHPSFIQRVGMYGSANSTGVYFALNEQCCFVAHIKSHVCDTSSSNIRHKISKLEGLDLKEQVTERLHATISRMGFNVTNVGVTKPYTKRSLFMINPNMYNVDGSEQVGRYVAQAVWDYLGLKTKQYPVDREHSGFVTKLFQRPHMFLFMGTGEKTQELKWYEERKEDSEHLRDFNFEVESKGDWEGGDKQVCS